MHPIPIPGDTKDDPESDGDSSDIGEQAGRSADSESRHGYRAPPSKLMLAVLGVVAQFELEMMLERQWEGIAMAKSEARNKGRKPIAKDRGTTL